MDIIEKETVKEVPVQYWEKHYGCGQPYNCGYNQPYFNNSAPFASKGIGGTALGLSIGALALGIWNASRGRGFNLFGNNSSTPENININTISGQGSHGAPSTFQVWAKESEDIYNAQKALYDYALLDQNQRFTDRQTLNSELFGVYKSQIDADFGLYKSQRDASDFTNNRITTEIFNLYKETRDKDDEIRKEICDLKAQVAINSAIRPYQDKLLQSEINSAFGSAINYTDKKTCNVVYGQVVLPNEPTITGYVGANQCGCPRVITTTTTPGA